MIREYPTADEQRCQDCRVLPGRSHHDYCKTPAAKRQRQEQIKDEIRQEGGNPSGWDHPIS